MTGPITRVSIATATPPYQIDQQEAASGAHDSFASRFDDFDRLARVIDAAGIRSRHLAKPLDWYIQPRSWAERNAAYLAAADNLFVLAAVQSLDKAGLSASQVDTIVTVSSTGLATPYVDARVSDRTGFRADVEWAPVFGLDCADGVTGLGPAVPVAPRQRGSAGRGRALSRWTFGWKS